MKVAHIMNSKQAIQKLMGADLPIKLAFRLKKLIKECDPIVANFEELRIELINKNGTADENGKLVIPPEKLDDINKQLYELSMEDVDINITKIKLEDIPESAKITGQDAMLLEWIIDDE